ncbi:PEP-CTERM sorting domain-containing protein, partial [Desulfobacterales bacterium HSG17]|nr:PEP-CTERM sorting domain-containing protein [Desulfobacterales bacterium HSG17]
IHTGLNAGPVTYVGKTLDSGGAVGHGGSDAGYGTWYGNGDSWMGTFGATSLHAVSGVIEVPEPATMSLLAIGGLGMLLIRRRRRA